MVIEQVVWCNAKMTEGIIHLLAGSFSLTAQAICDGGIAVNHFLLRSSSFLNILL
jgi:hypothetical protein